jgi:hypothetical protein
VLDANVLYPFLVRDVLLSLAGAGLFRPLWTDAINREWTRSLIRRHPEREAKIEETVSVMNEAFPEAIIENYEDLVPALKLPDADDRHVLAAAVRGGASLIVTENVADFPATVLSHYDIEARTADEFTLDALEHYPGDVVSALGAMRRRYAKPPLSSEELLQAMLKCGLVATAAALKPHISVL